LGGRSALDLATLLAVSITAKTKQMDERLNSVMACPIDRVCAVRDQQMKFSGVPASTGSGAHKMAISKEVNAQGYSYPLGTLFLS
jgi:hypothetical protein